MKTDRAFAEIFGHRPDWLAMLAGRAFPVSAPVYPDVFHAKVECDLLLVPEDASQPQVVCEFQFYHDQSIFVRTEMARLGQWRRLNPVKQCRRRDYVPRKVEAFIVFGEPGHVPAGVEEFPAIRHVILGERLAELEAREPGWALAALLRPVVEALDGEVEARAADDYRVLCENAELSEEDRRCFSTIFVQFLMQRFRTRSPEGIRAMIAELIPVEETRAGRELMDKGFERAQKGAIIEALEIRFGEVPGEVRESVVGFGDASRLRELLRAAIQAATLEEFVRAL